MVSTTDYYPFGSPLPGRSFNSSEYSFGFQGQEKDDEIADVEGAYVNYKYRMHNTRLGRFFSVDPLTASYPHNSPYAFSENRLIDGIELEGLEVYVRNNEISSYGGFGQIGWGYISGKGNASDQVGITFYEYSKPELGITNEESIIGINVFSATARGGVDVASNTFDEYIDQGPVTSLSVGTVGSISIEGRAYEWYGGVNAGGGIGAAFATLKTEVTTSFSFSDNDVLEIQSIIGEEDYIGITMMGTKDLFTYPAGEKNYLGFKGKDGDVKTGIEMVNTTPIGDEDVERWKTIDYLQKEAESNDN